MGCRADFLTATRVVYDVYTHIQLDWLRPFLGHEQRQQAVRELRVAGLSDSGAGR